MEQSEIRIKIERYNNRCRVDYSLVPENIINRLTDRIAGHLSYKNPDHIWMMRRGRFVPEKISLYYRRTNLFASGLMYHLIERLENEGISIDVDDLRAIPPSKRVFRLYKDLPNLRDYQQQCVEMTDTHENGCFSLPTGLGKTVICMGIIHRKAVNTLFVVPNANLQAQTMKIFKYHFGSKNVGDSKSNPKIPIVVSTYHSLSNQPKTFFERFDMVMVDECHHSACDSIYELNKSLDNIYYRYFFSATPYRNDGTDLKLKSVSGEIIYSYKLTQAIADGWICRPYFFIYEILNINQTYRDAPEFKKAKTDTEKFRLEYSALIIDNITRNDKIKEVSTSLVNNGKQVLILVKEIRHGEKLNSLIPGSQFIRGESGKKGSAENQKILSEFESKKINVLIATSVIGEGTDVKTIDCVINAAGYKAKSDVVQKVGRALRIVENKQYAIVIDFLDCFGLFVEKHSRERINVYSDYGSDLQIVKSQL